FCVTRTDNCYSYTAQCSSNYTSLSLHDALPICESPYFISGGQQKKVQLLILAIISSPVILLDEILTGLDHASVALAWKLIETLKDRKSTRLNSSHVSSSYAVFCLKKKNISSNSN